MSSPGWWWRRRNFGKEMTDAVTRLGLRRCQRGAGLFLDRLLARTAGVGPSLRGDGPTLLISGGRPRLAALRRGGAGRPRPGPGAGRTRHAAATTTRLVRPAP